MSNTNLFLMKVEGSSMSGTEISIVRGKDPNEMVCKAVELVGGIESFVKRGDIVLIKPNAAFFTPVGPFNGVTVDPRINCSYQTHP